MNGDDKNFESQVDFVVSHYKYGAFSSSKAWSKLMRGQVPWWRRKTVAAAAVCVAMAASALVYNIVRFSDKDNASETATYKSAGDNIDTQIKENAKLEFTDAPIQEVVDIIESTYGVTILNVPSEDIRLTLSYEGSAEDIIDAINATCETNLRIEFSYDNNKTKKELSN